MRIELKDKTCKKCGSPLEATRVKLKERSGTTYKTKERWFKAHVLISYECPECGVHAEPNCPHENMESWSPYMFEHYYCCPDCGHWLVQDSSG